MAPDAEDTLPPVAPDCMRAFCVDCASDVPAEYHCLWAETGESWSICVVCLGDVIVDWDMDSSEHIAQIVLKKETE